MVASSWVPELALLPSVHRRGISPKEIGDIETDFPDVDLAFEARSFVAWWGQLSGVLFGGSSFSDCSYFSFSASSSASQFGLHWLQYPQKPPCSHGLISPILISAVKGFAHEIRHVVSTAFDRIDRCGR
jgi:hypothetical protein